MLSAAETTILRVISAAREEICEKTSCKPSDVSIHLMTHVNYDGNLEADWHVSTGYNETQVKGKVLADCVEEFCRRKGWSDAQTMLLSAPVKVEDI